MQSVALSLLTIDVTPTISSGAAYTAGDQVGGIQTLDKPCFDQNRFARLAQLAIIDSSNQKAALNLFLFNELPTVASVDNGAVDIASSELVSKCVGVLTVAASDYQTCKAATNAVAFKNFAETFWQSLSVNAKLYVVPVTTGTPTYGSTTALTFRYVFAREF